MSLSAIIEKNCNEVLFAAAANTKRYESARELVDLPSMNGFVEGEIHKQRFVMFLSNNDDAVALRVLWHHQYEPMSTKLWVDSSKQAKTIVDIGAHSGIYSLLAAKANANAKIVAFEPYHINYARLVVNVRANHILNVEPHYAAVSDKTGYQPFSVQNNDMGYLTTGGSLVRDFQIKMPTAVVRLDEMMNSVDLVKIDTEGNELKCLRGMGKLLQSKPDILFECSQNKQAIFNLLHENGYRIYAVDDRNERVTRVTAPIESKDALDINHWATTKDMA